MVSSLLGALPGGLHQLRECWLGSYRRNHLGQIVSQSKHTEDLRQVRQCDVAIAVLKVLVSRAGNPGPFRQLRLGPIVLQSMLPHSGQHRSDRLPIALYQRR